MEFEEEEEEETITDANKFNKWVNKQETKINKELFKKYFFFSNTICIVKRARQNK